jgi:leucyl-tRNA---protein transferase
MDQAIHNIRRLSIYATGEHACAYLPERTARTLFVDPRESLNPVVYDQLMEQGFRRSGDYVYRPNCPLCSACKSLRIPIDSFRQSRRHKRCVRQNAGVSVHAQAPRFRPEHFRLYERYIAARHAGSQMDQLGPEQYYDFLTAPWCDTVFYEFREHAELLAVAVADRLPRSLSAVYTFYAPEHAHRGLGTLAILSLIEEARRCGHRYLYLGYWIEECAKMRYKSEFRPHEVHTGNAWQRVE